MPTLKSYTFAIRLNQSTIQKLQKSMSLPTHKNKKRKHNNMYSA
jgi:hypothetical protein